MHRCVLFTSSDFRLPENRFSFNSDWQLFFLKSVFTSKWPWLISWLSDSYLPSDFMCFRTASNGDARTGTRPGSHESALGFIAAVEKSVNVWADTQVRRHINKTQRFSMNQQAEPTHACTCITTQANKAGLRHPSASSPEVKLSLEGLKSSIWDPRDNRVCTLCVSRSNLSLCSCRGDDIGEPAYVLKLS